MKRLFALLAVLISVSSSQAAEPTVAALEAIGATVSQTNGVITEIKADCTNFGKDEYALIGQATSLKSLSLSGKSFTDENLAQLSGLKNLQSILINGGEITDEGMRGFLAFPNLSRLSLFHFSRGVEAFSGAGFAYLQPLANLRGLTHAGATTGDAAMAAIAQLQQLDSYSQWHNLESPAGFDHLAKMQNLKSLRVGQRLPARGRPLTPSFDGDTLAKVCSLKKLESLQIMEARLAYDDLAPLKTLTNLKRLTVKSVDTPAADVERLKKELEGVKIDWEPLSAEDAELLSKKLKL